MTQTLPKPPCDVPKGPPRAVLGIVKNAKVAHVCRMATMSCRPSLFSLLMQQQTSSASFFVQTLLSMCMEAKCCYHKGVYKILSSFQPATQVYKSVGVHVMYLHSCMYGDMRRRLQPIHCILLTKPPAQVAWILITPILAHLQYG